MNWRTFLVVLGAIGVCGCASVPRDAGFSDVRKTVAERTGHDVQWEGGGAEDRAVRARVRDLLAGELTADSAVQIALFNNRHVQATLEELGIGEADLVQAGLLKNPVFSLGVRFPDRSPGRTYLDIGVAEDFLDVALLGARKKLAAVEFAEVKARVTDEVLKCAADTAAKFYRYQTAAEALELRKQEAAAMTAAITVAEKMHDAGNLNELELAMRKSQALRVRVELDNARAEADEAREGVNAALGLWGADTDWKAAAKMSDLPGEEMRLERIELLAVRRRADLAAAQQEVFAAAQKLGLTEKYRFAEDLKLGPEADRETDGQWRIGPAVEVPIPLFDQGQAGIARGQAVLRQSEDRYYAMVVDVRSEVRAARLRLQNAREKARLYRDEILPAQEQVMQQMQLQFDGMFKGVFELLSAKRDRIDAQREYIGALRDYWIARVDLERAVGGRLPAGNATTQEVNAVTKAGGAR